MSDAQEDKIMLLHETVLQSIGRDLTAYCLIVAVIGTGWYLGSPAMQWLGFLMLCCGAVARLKNTPRYTPQQAANKLRADFGVIAE